MNIWHDMRPELLQRDAYTVFTSNSMGSTAVLSFDGETGLMQLDHLSDPYVASPFNTGYLPRTHAADGMPAETVILCSRPLPPMTLVRCRPVGVIFLHLENGGVRKLLLSAAFADEFWSACMTVEEIPTADRKALVRYLRYDQQTIGRPVSSIEFAGLADAERYLEACRKDYLLRYSGAIPADGEA